MVPFAVYSAFETSQFHVQDGGSHTACVNNSKICAKAWGKWRQNRIIPSLLLRKIGSDIAGGLLRLVEILDFILFSRRYQLREI